MTFSPFVMGPMPRILDVMAQRYHQRPSQIVKGAFWDFDFDLLVMTLAMQEEAKAQPGQSGYARQPENGPALRHYLSTKTAEELMNEPPQQNWQKALMQAALAFERRN